MVTIFSKGVAYTISADDHKQFCQQFKVEEKAFEPYFQWLSVAHNNGTTCVDKNEPHNVKGIIYTVI
jgi:hypothetical protein